MTTQKFTFWALPMMLVFILFTQAIIAGTNELSIPLIKKEDGKESLLMKTSLSLSANITSQHLWRATSAGTAPCIEPLVTFTHGNFKMNAWMSYALDNSYKEIDFFATYDVGAFRFGLFDYYCPSEEASNRFFEFEKSKTRHLFEAQASWLGSKNIPLSLTAACFIGGFDMDASKNQLYSTYFEANYGINAGKNRIAFTIGGTPANGMYAPQASIFNYGITLSRTIPLGEKWQMPCSGKLVYNKENKEWLFSLTIGIS